jgi:hypothetical protein
MNLPTAYRLDSSPSSGRKIQDSPPAFENKEVSRFQSGLGGEQELVSNSTAGFSLSIFEPAPILFAAPAARS